MTFSTCGVSVVKRSGRVSSDVLEGQQAVGGEDVLRGGEQVFGGDGVQPLEEPAGPRSLSEVEGPVVRHRSPAGQSILDTAKADTAVMDIMAEKQAWRTDRPGMPVKNIISAISLNDRVLLINVLFGEDPMLFQETIAKFNAMGSLSEALDFISENHPDWDMNSEPVYRLMMAVRRKLS